MKKLLFSVLCLFTLSFAFAQSKVDEVVKFNSETVDLGKIEQGHPATAVFVVKNIGTTPLVIEDAKPTCGCTIGDYTKEPIMPGKEGKITAQYNAAAVGPIHKTMNVKFAGFDEVKHFTITGEVLTTEEFAKLPKKTEAKKTDNKKKAS